MNEEYLKGLHEHLGIKEDYDTWISKTQDNDEYLQGLHGHLGIKDDYGTWKTKTWGEKKNSDDITSTQEPSSETATTTAEESVSETPSTSTEETPTPVVEKTETTDPYYLEKGQEVVESLTPQYGVISTAKVYGERVLIPKNQEEIDRIKPGERYLDLNRKVQTKEETQPIPNNETVQADSEQAIEEFQETGKVDVESKVGVEPKVEEDFNEKFFKEDGTVDLENLVTGYESSAPTLDKEIRLYAEMINEDILLLSDSDD